MKLVAELLRESLTASRVDWHRISREVYGASCGNVRTVPIFIHVWMLHQTGRICIHVKFVRLLKYGETSIDEPSIAMRPRGDNRTLRRFAESMHMRSREVGAHHPMC